MHKGSLQVSVQVRTVHSCTQFLGLFRILDISLVPMYTKVALYNIIHDSNRDAGNKYGALESINGNSSIMGKGIEEFSAAVILI